MAQFKVILAARPVWVLVLVAVVMAAVFWTIGLMTPTTPGFRGPLVDINDGIMIAILVALGGFVLNLYNRIGKLETDLQTFRSENDTLRTDLRAATTFIDRVGLWMVAGMPASKRPRQPKQLAEYIDPELWGEDIAVGGTDPT